MDTCMHVSMYACIHVSMYACIHDLMITISSRRILNSEASTEVSGVLNTWY